MSSNLPRVGVIGMGTMGRPMAINLVQAGFPVTVFNRKAGKCAEAVAAGARQAGSLAELAGAADVVVSMLSDDEAVERVLTGEDGILAHGRAGMLVIDSSTIHPETSRRVAVALQKQSIDFLDAPVTGSKPQAEAGKLFFLVGGPAAAYERALPLFDAMGRKHVHLGENGMGTCAKLCNNMAGFINLAGFCEALMIARSFGLEEQKLYEVISDSGGRSAMSDGKGAKILGRNWQPDFALGLAHKDLELAQRFATALGVASPVAAKAAGVFGSASRSGLSAEDVCGLYRWYEQEGQAR